MGYVAQQGRVAVSLQLRVTIGAVGRRFNSGHNPALLTDSNESDLILVLVYFSW